MIILKAALLVSVALGVFKTFTFSTARQLTQNNSAIPVKF